VFPVKYSKFGGKRSSSRSIFTERDTDYKGASVPTLTLFGRA
jgi:hypothetical protein